jgi:hypothetical protein
MPLLGRPTAVTRRNVVRREPKASQSANVSVQGMHVTEQGDSYDSSYIRRHRGQSHYAPLRAVEEAKRQADLTLVSFHSHEMKDGRMSGLYEPTVAIVRPASLG